MAGVKLYHSVLLGELQPNPEATTSLSRGSVGTALVLSSVMGVFNIKVFAPHIVSLIGARKQFTVAAFFKLIITLATAN